MHPLFIQRILIICSDFENIAGFKNLYLDILCISQWFFFFSYLLFRSARTSWITFVSPPVRGQEKSGSTVQLYKSTMDHCQPIIYCLVVSGGVWSMSCGVWWCLMHVWWCLVVSMYLGWYDLNWLMYMGRYPFQCMQLMLLRCWCCWCC